MTDNNKKRRAEDPANGNNNNNELNEELHHVLIAANRSQLQQLLMALIRENPELVSSVEEHLRKSTPKRRNYRWRKVDQKGVLPPPSYRHVAVYTDNNKILLFGGAGNNQIFNTVYEFSLETQMWLPVVTLGDVPSPRYNHSMNYVPEEHKLILFGGQDFRDSDNAFNDLYEFDIATSRWTKINPIGTIPTPRYGHSCSLVKRDGKYKLILFGGHASDAPEEDEEDMQFYNDAYEYNIKERRWMTINAASVYNTPSPRENHTAVAFNSDNGETQAIYFFGGLFSTGQYAFGCCNDAYKLVLGAGGSYKWECVHPESGYSEDAMPPRRAEHVAILNGREMIVFGGNLVNHDQSKAFLLDDIYSLDIENKTWTKVEASGDRPSGRWGHTLVQLPNENRAILFGGQSENETMNDMYILELDNSSNNNDNSDYNNNSK